MNHILENEKNDILAYHIKDGFKVIYPVKNVKIQLIRHYRLSSLHNYTIYSTIKSGLNCWNLNLWDRLINCRNDLFLTPCMFNNGGHSELIISKGDAKASLNLGDNVDIYSGVNYLGSESKFYEKIKYILFNQDHNTLRIVIDDNFKTKAAQKYELTKNENKKLGEELDLDLS